MGSSVSSMGASVSSGGGGASVVAAPPHAASTKLNITVITSRIQSVRFIIFCLLQNGIEDFDWLISG
jgi:hypothetical protein